MFPGMLGMARTARPLECGGRGDRKAAAGGFLGADEHGTGGMSPMEASEQQHSTGGGAAAPELS